MRNVELLMISLEYIELNLRDELKTEDVAAACYCSKSTLEKLFRCVYHISVHGYIVRRRMMLAARCLVREPARSILDIAMEHGYSTHESFARAFEQVWNCKPSEFRKRKYTELFPRFRMPLKNGDEYNMSTRHVDISELYDLFQERKDCYFVCCDIKQMMRINNEFSRKAGDLAILEALDRMGAAAGENDVVFRIGGDEFCILTDNREASYAEGLVEKICARNGEAYVYEGREIPLTLHAAALKVSQTSARYDELFLGLHNAMYNAIKSGKTKEQQPKVLE